MLLDFFWGSTYQRYVVVAPSLNNTERLNNTSQCNLPTTPHPRVSKKARLQRVLARHSHRERVRKYMQHIFFQAPKLAPLLQIIHPYTVSIPSIFNGFVGFNSLISVCVCEPDNVGGQGVDLQDGVCSGTYTATNIF